MTPLRVYNVLISTQHEPGVTNETIRDVLINQVIKKVIPEKKLLRLEVFCHHVSHLFLSSDVFQINVLVLTYLSNPIKIDPVSTMKMTKCGRTTFLNDLNNSLVVFQND